ncbi:MAG: hypothetical protein M3P26_17290 [Gemmatimonadota bacterium]|nr:hypothetical protein [Gemmatimonadota bacterium]
MIPAPNVIAGILIGIANDSWVTVLGAAAVWPFVFCIYVSIMDRSRREATVASFAHRGRHLVAGSPILTFYVIEFATALATVIPVALFVQGLKRLMS